jgi:acetyl-CoA carboxylase biotin carboxyl carrier protein
MFLKLTPELESTLKKSINKKKTKVITIQAAKTTAKNKKSVAKKNMTASRPQIFSVDIVKAFYDFMKAQDLVELDLEEGGRKIRLRRSHPQVTSMGLGQLPSAAMPVAQSEAVHSQPVPSVVANVSKNYIVTSPFVGTFYRSPGPNQDSFVEEGQNINAGDTLCIVEAMKLMNEIESDVKGRVVKVLVKDGTPVEFGAPLFEVDAQ